MHPHPPSQPHVVFLLPDGREVVVPPGGILGRARTAHLRIDDPRVSEAHALISLRGRQLRLIALRGALRTRGGTVEDLALREGQRLDLAPDLTLRVVRIVLPDHALALAGVGPLPKELVASVHCLRVHPHPELTDEFDPTAPAVFWSTAEGWRAQIAGQEAQDLELGQHLLVDGLAVEVVGLPISALAVAPTRKRPTELPLRLVLRQETVHVHREGQSVTVIEGMSARLLCEIARFEAPTPWEWVAREVWGTALDRETLRQRWDRNLRTLRGHIREHRLPAELVRADGHGNIELVLGPGDAVVDQG